MLKNGTPTYISLFSSAGVGCFGFKQAGFECIATNEIIARRLEVQKYNNKCKFDTGYICDDITKDETKKLIFNEIELWKKNGNDKVDVIIATPPCQGMSVVNHKKKKNEIIRNSLVVESIKIIKEIKPRFFVFENVASFMKTGCTAPNGDIKTIGEVIEKELGTDYSIISRILNFKNYGSNSSRTRTLVIGVSNELSDNISPIELYPKYREEKTLKKVIGKLPSLKWGEILKTDFYHAFRIYPKEMRNWISDIKEGESAFDNEDIKKKPHKIIKGKIVVNVNKNGDKYRRQYWNKVAPCIHTRTDQLASQNTIHPKDDRVFSIRELMLIMTIPKDFKWINKTLNELNELDNKTKIELLRKEEIKIRQCIGEAVPTSVFNAIAINIKNYMLKKHISNNECEQLIKKYKLNISSNLIEFINKHKEIYGISTLSKIAELANSLRENNSAYFTNKILLNEIYKELPEFEAEEINIIEPSVGTGNFIPFIFAKYENIKKVNIDVVDIDSKNIEVLKLLIEIIGIPKNIKINYIVDDFLLHKFKNRYDLVIGNPPFSKLKANDSKKYIENNVNKHATNTFEFFLEKAIRISNNISLITPKSLLNTPEFIETRKMLSRLSVNCIIDFGEKGFKGVLVETICIFVKTNNKPKITKVRSLTKNITLQQNQKYIMDDKYPYWIIYRDKFFDKISNKMSFGVFDVFRDRQITNKNTYNTKNATRIRVLKSKNISDNGNTIIDIPNYDAYMDKNRMNEFSVYKFYNDEGVYLTPNMTYKPRVINNVRNVVVNGSIAVLIPKNRQKLTKTQLQYFSTDEYRQFYQIARNFQTRSLNVDSSSVFFYGVLKK